MKKGLFSSLTGLVLIIIIVFSLIGLFWIKSVSLDFTSTSYTQGQEQTKVKQAKDQLLLCHSQTYLEAAKLDTDACPSLLPYTVHQLPYLGCEEQSWSHGNTQPGSLQYVYKVAVAHTDGERCIADLVLYMV